MTPTSVVKRRLPPRSAATRGSALLLALGTALAHLAAAAIATAILLMPAPRWYLLFEITGTPLPVLSRLAWSLSLWLRQLLPLVLLAAPVAFVADAVLAYRLFQRSPRRAAWQWLAGVLVLELVATTVWLVAALLLPRREL